MDASAVRVYGVTDLGYVVYDRGTGGGNFMYAWTSGTTTRFIAPDHPFKTSDGDRAYSLGRTGLTQPGENYAVYTYLVTAPVQEHAYTLTPGQQGQFAVRDRNLAVREMGSLGMALVRVTRSDGVQRLGRRPASTISYGYEANAASPAGSAAFIFTEGGVTRVLVASASGREPFVAEVPADSRLIERNGKILLVSAGSVYLVD
jgi:hypothetical protein